jgi:uncharacterized membrane protein required for colicin V production
MEINLKLCDFQEDEMLLGRIILHTAHHHNSKHHLVALFCKCVIFGKINMLITQFIQFIRLCRLLKKQGFTVHCVLPPCMNDISTFFEHHFAIWK